MSIIEIKLTKEEYKKAYTFGERFNIRIFRLFFPSIVKVSIINPLPSNKGGDYQLTDGK